MFYMFNIDNGADYGIDIYLVKGESEEDAKERLMDRVPWLEGSRLKCTGELPAADFYVRKAGSDVIWVKAEYGNEVIEGL